jgi:phosphoglycolate phosphatase-like HAD superfamily hydrolase
MSSARQVLREFAPTKAFFVGIDSDGCVFDTMEIKHRQCFGPMFIEIFGLEAVAGPAREVWEFVNLRSRTRGANRFQALVRALQLLREHPQVRAAGGSVPDPTALAAWVARETRLSNATLQREVDHGNRALAPTLAWSYAVNQAVERTVTGVPPFPGVREALRAMSARADIGVVAQAPVEALVREWEEHDLRKYVRLVAGQELGSKADHLKLAAGGKYPPDHILMLGDALGDLKAAQACHALFYPILPGREPASWARLRGEMLDRFFAGTYAGADEDRLIGEFEASLPEKPGW